MIPATGVNEDFLYTEFPVLGPPLPIKKKEQLKMVIA